MSDMSVRYYFVCMRTQRTRCEKEMFHIKKILYMMYSIIYVYIIMRALFHSTLLHNLPLLHSCILQQNQG